jgi:hypothetical protein
LSIFHGVASDEEVKKIITDPTTQLDEKGRPTRRVKVEWLCRHVGVPEYRDVVETDLVSAIECIKLMHDGAHSISGVRFEQNFIMVRRRVRVAIRHLLLIWAFRSN